MKFLFILIFLITLIKVAMCCLILSNAHKIIMLHILSIVDILLLQFFFIIFAVLHIGTPYFAKVLLIGACFFVSSPVTVSVYFLFLLEERKKIQS